MTHEEFKELINTRLHEINMDYEDFIGTTFTENEHVWAKNLLRVLEDTALFSKASYYETKEVKHQERRDRVADILDELGQVYLDRNGQSEVFDTLDLKEQSAVYMFAKIGNDVLARIRSDELPDWLVQKIDQRKQHRQNESEN